LANPWAVMIKTFHAVIADRAVWASGRSVKQAGVTVFDLHTDSINNDVLCPRQTELLWCLTPNIIAPINAFRFRRMSITRYYTRVSTRCKKKQRQILEKEKKLSCVHISTKKSLGNACGQPWQVLCIG
jgi:hypothetical protein